MVARQAPLSMGFSRQEYWSGLACPPPEGLPDPGIELASLTSPASAGEFFTSSATWEAKELTKGRKRMDFAMSSRGKEDKRLLFIARYLIPSKNLITKEVSPHFSDEEVEVR